MKKLNIGLLGYGKMGKAIEPIALERGHAIAWKIGSSNRDQLDASLIRKADVVIEFSRPEAAAQNVNTCLLAGRPVVSGTTGWLEELAHTKDWVTQHQGSLLWASNFSVGVNLLFTINRYLAELMNRQPQYNPEVEETHHVHKIDAPSGTALSLTYDILRILDRKNGWVLNPAVPNEDEILVTAFREDEVPGTHTVRWTGLIDEITLEHRAYSRAGFAGGAVLAAEWLHGKTGIYTMNDVLGIPMPQ